jgi:hypothetical protein
MEMLDVFWDLYFFSCFFWKKHFRFRKRSDIYFGRRSAVSENMVFNGGLSFYENAYGREN